MTTRRGRAAREEILIAEGSDWFWWYGDDHSSEHDLEFDDLFRRHLRNVYRALRVPVPEELFMTNITTEPVGEPIAAPVGFVRPVVDGEVTELLRVARRPATSPRREPAGPCSRGSRGPPLVRLVSFGFDLDRLHLRLDLAGRASEFLQRGVDVQRELHRPRRAPGDISAGGRPTGGRHAGARSRTAAGPHGRRMGCSVRLGRWSRLRFRSLDLGAGRGQAVAFFVLVQEAGSPDERYPAQRPIEMVVPGEDFEALQWWTP